MKIRIYKLFTEKRNSRKKSLLQYEIILCLILKPCKHFLYICPYRQHPWSKNARKIRSISQAKLLDSKGIFKFWTYEQQDLISIHKFISFASINQTVLTVKRAWNGFHFFSHISIMGVVYFKHQNLYHVICSLTINNTLVFRSFLHDIWVVYIRNEKYIIGSTSYMRSSTS